MELIGTDLLDGNRPGPGSSRAMAAVHAGLQTACSKLVAMDRVNAEDMIHCEVRDDIKEGLVNDCVDGEVAEAVVGSNARGSGIIARRTPPFSLIRSSPHLPQTSRPFRLRFTLRHPAFSNLTTY